MALEGRAELQTRSSTVLQVAEWRGRSCPGVWVEADQGAVVSSLPPMQESARLLTRCPLGILLIPLARGADSFPLVLTVGLTEDRRPTVLKAVREGPF